MEKLDAGSVLEFMELVNVLKHRLRKGWEHFDVQAPETISGHMYAMAMMTFLIDDNSDLNKYKCMQLALVHDLAECIVGDITPRDNIPVDVKHEMEYEAMRKISPLIGSKLGSVLFNLYEEYEKQSTPEAKFVKDLDRFDLIFTAFGYEKRDKTPGLLQEFYDTTKGVFKSPLVIKLNEELQKQREQFIAESQDVSKDNKSMNNVG